MIVPPPPPGPRHHVSSPPRLARDGSGTTPNNDEWHDDHSTTGTPNQKRASQPPSNELHDDHLYSNTYIYIYIYHYLLLVDLYLSLAESQTLHVNIAASIDSWFLFKFFWTTERWLFYRSTQSRGTSHSIVRTRPSSLQQAAEYEWWIVIQWSLAWTHTIFGLINHILL